MPAVLNWKFVSKEATSEAAILKLSWQRGLVCVTSFRLTRNWREGQKPATDVTLSQGQQNLFFSQAIIQFFNAIIRSLEHVWLKIIWLKRSYSGQLWEGMTRKLGLAAEYSSKWRQRCSNFGLLWRRISYEKSALQRLKRRWVANLQCKLFVIVDKKYMFFRVTFSFKYE